RTGPPPPKIERVKIEPTSLAGVLLSRKRLIGAMVLAVALVAALAFWDTERESAAALDDFAAEQTTLATSASADLGARAPSPGSGSGDPLARAEALFEGAKRIEEPEKVRLFVVRPDDARLHGTDGTTLAAPEIERAIAEGRSRVWLSRDEAGAL